jgi:hypothetical protein
MFRHVVMFRWTDESTPDDRERAIAGLRAFAEQVRDLGTARIGVDAGLDQGNFDVVVVADFADRATYLRYAADPRHLAMSKEHVAPILAVRAAVQTELSG